MGRRAIVAIALVLMVVASALAQDVANWIAGVRNRVEEKDFAGAKAIVEARLQAVPDDLEALAWRARLLSWTGDWKQAETEYRAALERAPDDADILVGLADVLTWQQRAAEALPLLERAGRAGAAQTEVLVRRGQVLTALDRRDEALATFHAVLAVDPNNAQAKAAVAAVIEEPRHELRVGTDTDFFNYTDTAQAQTISLRSRWAPRWTTHFTASFYQRFGEEAQKANFTVTHRLGRRDWLTLGGGVANNQPIVARGETIAEYGHGFLLGPGFVRGVEVTLQQRSLWFTGSQVAIFGSTAIAYLPHDVTWAVTIAAARSRFEGAGAEWTPSGSTRLAFPIANRLRGNLSFGVGAENFANADQVGRFAARTYGGGLRYQLTRLQDIGGYTAWQDRSQGRTQTSMGFSYGIRF
ncbi:MAG: tetratricopeptide repeat protein [Terriglobales bacterium]